MKGGLTRRTTIASALLALVVGAAFLVLLIAIINLRSSTQLRRQTREELIAADALQKLVLDLETGLRGFIITGEERFLDPWNDGRAAFPEQARALERLVADDPVQLEGVQRIVQDGMSYIRDYSLPLVEAARRNDPSARSVERTEEGKRRVDALRAEFGTFAAAGRDDLTARETTADEAGGRAIVAGVAGLAGSIVLVSLFAGYLRRTIVRPIRRAAAMADRIAGGDLGTRSPETGAGEIGELERSFNTMASSLQRSRDEFARLADEQAALRRVATLVASQAAPEETFAAVAHEVAQLLRAHDAAMVRFEPDGGTLVVAALGKGLGDTPVGARWEPHDYYPTTAVWRTGRSARVDEDVWSSASGPVADALRRLGLASVIASPIIVQGRLWGAIVVSTTREPLPEDTEQRLAGFTELVGTAISNAQTRTELAASRVRIVAAGDETRRRIERDLHDGTQQRLVSIGLELRAAEDALPPDQAKVKKELAHLADGLTDVLDELREMSRGIHPAILSEGGLGPALKALARRSAVPVELDFDVQTRLPEQVEVASYYVVSEALTNTAKHARATVARLQVEMLDNLLRVLIRDDGVGAADPSRGSGLIGLTDRVEALGGTITVLSPPGEGTSVLVELPLGSH